MSDYKHALIAINLAKDSHPQVIEKALNILDPAQCRISLVYVIRPLAYSYDRGLTLGLIDHGLEKLQDEAEEQTRDRMKKLAKQYNLAEDRVHTITGTPSAEVIRLSKELKCDLLVLGNNHKRKLLGQTKGAILHDIECDTLMVSLDDK